MASWKQSFKVTYEKSLSSYVALPDSPIKDCTDICEGAISGDVSERAVSPEVTPEHNRHSSLPPIELNCHLKIKKTSLRASDCKSEGEEKEFQFLPHFSLLHHTENFDEQQCINKDMLCTVVKDMELSSKMSETDLMDDSSENLEHILEDLSEDNIEMKCMSFLNFAKKFYVSEKFRSRLDEVEVLSVMLKTLPDLLSFNSSAFCYAVFLCVLSHYPKEKSNQRLMELLLVKFLQSTTNKRKSDAVCVSSADVGGYEMNALPKNVMEKSLELCRLMSISKDWELQEINITFLNCVSAQKMFGHSTKGEQRCNNTDILCCVMDKIHEHVQQLSSKKQGYLSESSDYLINLRMIWKCLQALEMASLFHPENQKYLVTCQNSAISRHSNRILGFCMKYLYYDSLPQRLDVQMVDSDTNEKEKIQFYLKSCLISILKVLLNISHNCKEAVIKLGAIDGLMEKLLMCILTIGSPKTEEQFAVIILCLELLINLIEPCWANHKAFAILCLKKFRNSVDSNVHAVEQLIEILAEGLNEISLLEKFSNEVTKDVDDSSRVDEIVKNSDEAKAECVFIVAGKHMEQHMVCAYICILLGFFVDIKRTFRDLVHEKMPRETIEQALLVSKRFLRFVALTEGTGQNSIRSLNVMMSTLQSIHDGR